jgi:hypothetical protein
MYGSFGMDTPNARLDSFSPMGTSFTSFDDEYSNLPMPSEALDNRLSAVAEEGQLRRPTSISQHRPRSPPDDYLDFRYWNGEPSKFSIQLKPST